MLIPCDGNPTCRLFEVVFPGTLRAGTFYNDAIAGERIYYELDSAGVLKAFAPEDRAPLEKIAEYESQSAPSKKGTFVHHGWAKPDDPIFSTGPIVNGRKILRSSENNRPNTGAFGPPASLFPPLPHPCDIHSGWVQSLRMRWHMRRTAAAVILMVSSLSLPMACPALAGPVEDSLKAYRSGDYKTAYQLVKPQAEKGDADAQFILGFLYDEGKGVPQDSAEAAKWYERAVKQGNKAARHNLGLMGDQSQVSKDRAEMGKWHRRAAKRGNAADRPTPGLTDGQGQVSKDRAGMGMWHRGAAERGNAAARSTPGLMDRQGRGIPKYSPEMEKWHRRAAEPETSAAQSRLGLAEAQDQVSKDRAEMGKWHRGAAEQGNAASRPAPGLMDRKGRGIPKFTPEMEKWHRRAVEPETAVAQPPNRGLMDDQDQVSKDRAGMGKWHRGAAE